MRTKAFVSLLLGCAVAFGCAPRDPVEQVLERRNRWAVELLSTVQREDGSLLAQFRLAGPVKRELDHLTIRIDLHDAGGDVRESVWHAFDLTGIQRGTPTELMVVLPALDPPAEGVTFSSVPAPGEEDRRHIVELQGL
jgi:hypothetical protein